MTFQLRSGSRRKLKPFPKQAAILHRIDVSGAAGISPADIIRTGIPEGTVYVALQRLESYGFVRSRLIPRGSPGQKSFSRRIYTLTDEGRSFLSSVNEGRSCCRSQGP